MEAKNMRTQLNKAMPPLTTQPTVTIAGYSEPKTEEDTSMVKGRGCDVISKMIRTKGDKVGV
jgi:hypothetical protein